jgi:carotenoid cleavage dioxygenase-like enzyme
MMHDFAATRNHVIFMDLPVVFDLDEAIKGNMPYLWSDTYGARLGVMPRNGTNADVRWFDIDPCFVFHTMNAFEDDEGRIVMDAGRHASMWKGSSDNFEPCVQWRWTLDPRSGKVTEQQVDDRNQAFPRVDDRRAGLPYRYGWVQLARPGNDGKDINGDSMLSKYDVVSGTRVDHDFGSGMQLGEPVFVPREGSTAEDDGYVMTYLWDKAEGCSSFVILSGQDFAGEPIATVVLPQRVPHGFHGSWVPA